MQLDTLEGESLWADLPHELVRELGVEPSEYPSATRFSLSLRLHYLVSRDGELKGNCKLLVWRSEQEGEEEGDFDERCLHEEEGPPERGLQLLQRLLQRLGGS